MPFTARGRNEHEYVSSSIVNEMHVLFNVKLTSSCPRDFAALYLQQTATNMCPDSPFGRAVSYRTVIAVVVLAVLTECATSTSCPRDCGPHGICQVGVGAHEGERRSWRARDYSKVAAAVVLLAGIHRRVYMLQWLDWSHVQRATGT